MVKSYGVNIGKGMFRSLIATLILTIILAVVMSFIDFSVKSINLSYVIITCISLVMGATYASKRNGERGWLIGLLVGLGYYILLFIISSIFNGKVSFSMFDIYKFVMAMIVGILSGMLGINI